MKSNPAFVLVLLPLGCAENAEQFLSTPADASALEFLVLLRNDRPVDVWGPKEFLEGPVRIERQSGDRLAKVVVPSIALEELDPLLDASALRSLDLRPRIPCAGCGSTCIEDQSTLLSLPLPGASEISELEGESFQPASGTLIDRVKRETRLELERSADDCRWRSQSTLDPFGVEDELAGDTTQGIRAIDRDRLLSSDARRFMLMLRGRDRADNERRTLTADELGHAGIGGSAIISMTSTSVRLLVVGRSAEEESVPESAIYEVEGSEQGLRVVTERARVPGILLSVLSTDDGGFVAAGFRGLVVVARPGMAPSIFTLGESFKITALDRFDSERGEFFLGGSFGFVAEGDLFAGPGGMILGSLERGDGLLDSSVTGFRLRPRPEGPEVWTITRGQGVFRRTGPARWEAVDVEAPPGAEICALMPDPCGRARLMEINEGLEFGDDGRMFYTPWMCAALFTRAPAEPCTKFVDLSALPNEPGLTITNLRRTGNTLFFFVNRAAWSVEL